MTVICLTNCPTKLRGDLSKWLIEINTGVYVGNISARVRDKLWERITENIHSGQATMVFRATGEQHMDFRVHNTTWKPVDYEGLKLIMRPRVTAEDANNYLAKGFSKAAKMRKLRRIRHAEPAQSRKPACVVFDLKTTGLVSTKDEIIEMAAIRVFSDQTVEEFSCLVQPERDIPDDIQKLTGITEKLASEAGLPLKEALFRLCTFLGTERLVCWNTPFDLAFLQVNCSRCGLPVPKNKADDAMRLARKIIKNLPDYRLTTAAQYYGLDSSGAHRALRDCYLTHAVYNKLNENSQEV